MRVPGDRTAALWARGLCAGINSAPSTNPSVKKRCLATAQEPVSCRGPSACGHKLGTDGKNALHLARGLVCAYAVSSMLESYAPALHAEKTMSRPSRVGGW